MLESATLFTVMTNRPECGVRRRTLFLSYLYPSFLGTGSQIRAAALVRMLAAREDVHVLVVHPHENTPGPRDIEMEGLCRKMEFVPLLSDEGAADSAPRDGESAPRAIEKSKLIGPIQRFYEENRLDSLFVYRLESCFLLKGRLDLFPRRYLDLDELASRRINMLDQLKAISIATTPEPTDRRLQLAIRMMEREIIPRFEKTFASSEVEVAEARRLAGNAQVHVLPNIFPGRSIQHQTPVSQPREILFVGSFAHFPNVDAVLYFHRAIFPLILQKLSAPVIFRVVGSSSSELLLEMGRDPQVRFMGYQESLDPYYARASLAVVPLRAGAGTRIKILEAFVHGRPVVSTTIGAAGLAVTHGENILLADTPEDFAQACVQVLENPSHAARLVQGGKSLHRERYSAETLLRLYDKAMNEKVP